MNEVYGSIAPKEKERIESIEMLDEHELLKQLFDHYCIVVAYNDAMTLSLESVELHEFDWEWGRHLKYLITNCQLY